MAVYKLTYKGHEGESTPTWSRFLIPARYNYAKLTSIRFLMLFVTVSMFYPIYGAIYVYLSANPSFLATMGFMPFEIDGSFFYTFCQVGTLTCIRKRPRSAGQRKARQDRSRRASYATN